MAIAGYLISIDAKRFEKLNQALSAKAQVVDGDLLVATSSSRAFLSIDSLKYLRVTISGDALSKTFRQFGADWESQLDDSQAFALLQTRDPSDLPPRKVPEQDPVLDSVTGEYLDWHLVESNIHRAWEVMGGRESIDWGGVSVGHIDTGFTRHPVLGFRKDSVESHWVDTVHDRNYFSREIGQISDSDTPGGLFVSYDDAEDTLGGFSAGHGTRTGSVLCGYDRSASAKRSAKAGAAYAGYFGAAPKVPVVPIRMEDTIWIQNELGSGLPDALDYLVESAGVRVISLSMGSPSTILTGTDVSKRLKESLRNAYNEGVIVVCAAGNHIPNEKVVFPARLAHTIAVAGSAPSEKLWTGSSYGKEVDISAPAYPIRRATTNRGNKFVYGIGDGTSFATPQVAGTAAMWLAHNDASIQAMYPEKWQRVAAFLMLLKSTARVPLGWDRNTRGAGLLNAGALVSTALPPAETLHRDNG
jgi:subtilisin family serine protease